MGGVKIRLCKKEIEEGTKKEENREGDRHLWHQFTTTK